MAKSSRKWFTADTHFGHVGKGGHGIIDLCQRPFSSIEEMDDAITENWNSRVDPGDIVYHLGDFAFTSDISILSYYFNRLNGHIVWIVGNHDLIVQDKNGNLSQKKCAEIQKHIKKITRIENLFRISVRETGEGNAYNQKIVMCHYPLESWRSKQFGAWQLHGHQHGTMPQSQGLDVGVDNAKYMPTSYDEVKEHFTGKKREKYNADSNL